jgi:RNA polymerase sigma-70 factor (ECF subfamily)
MPPSTPSSPIRASRSDSVSSALQQTLARHSHLVRLAARRRNLSELDIDEIFQDVRIRLWRALVSGERIELAPGSYIYRTAISAVLDLVRRRAARHENEARPLENGLIGLPNDAPDEAVEGAELRDRLSQTIANLSERRRIVVRMYLEGYTRHEISRSLGWTEAATRNLLYRGLADLRAELSSVACR